MFATFSRLAQEHSAINLGQGFPDFEPPPFVLEALARSRQHHQQYAPLPGLLEPIVPDGGYFVLADSHALPYQDDVALCLDLPRRCGLVAIPPSAFYSSERRHLARQLVRFAFCKDDAVLRDAARRLGSL